MPFGIVLFFILGLVVGSFISAYSFRYPKGISIARGRSFCPNCKKQIGWIDNIPLLSFLLLGGRCRNCKKPISFRYPIIEFASAIGFVFIYLKFTSDSLSMIYYLLIFCLLILIFVIDLENQIIPDDFIFFGFVVAVLFSLFAIPYSLFPNLFAGFLSALTLLLIHLATRGRGMGLGDVKFAIFGGILTGVNLFLIWLFLSFLTGGIVGSILILAKRAGLKSKIAFGPFLVFGLVLTLLYGNEISRLIGF